ncbi:MAG: porin [Bradyrhizobium sp.]|uniref:porin n=1 Tax=Bradyrhizobium sp. TaxID=376 RepID=UPI001C29090B|nr:porin [Bradyrhizobium sp.]MBU6461839.1 porin [Pseudomonadota bacterium]MDE2066160.1 porin [Bradyrhizobium sp.]MDE2469112.1 porin [Bradyrhizobium sp.]
MRNILLIVPLAALSISTAAADSLARQKPSSDAIPGKPFAAERIGRSHVCAAYGPGFVKVDGSDTCVKVGGSISAGVSGRR